MVRNYNQSKNPESQEFGEFYYYHQGIIEGVSQWGLGCCIEVILGVMESVMLKHHYEGWAWYWSS